MRESHKVKQAKKSQKNFSKSLDKPLALWYNKRVEKTTNNLKKEVINYGY